MEASAQPKVGRIEHGWRITKSSWRVLKLDKELMGITLISTLMTSLIFAALGAFYFFMGDTTVTRAADGMATGLDFDSPIAWPIMFATMYIASTVVANFFAAAIIHGAIQRFEGGDPTLRSSLQGAMRKFRPLLLFSLMMATIGLIFQALEERLPFAGAIATYIFDAAWSVANVFAVPVIVMSKENVAPLTATKKSVAIIRKVWGEGIVASLGITAIAVVTMLFYTLLWMVLALVVLSVNKEIFTSGVPLVWPIVLGSLYILGAIAISIVFGTLSGIAKAALYHYATTGNSPQMYDKELLRRSMTPKKAQKVFAG